MGNLTGINIPSRQGRYVKAYDEAELAGLRAAHGTNWLNVSWLIEAWVSFLSDDPLHTDGLAHKNADFHRFREALKADTISVIHQYSALGDTLLRQLRVTPKGSSIGTFLAEFKETPIFGTYLNFFRNQDSSLLKYIISFLWFGKKLYYDSREIESESLRSWLDVENGLRLLEVPAWAPNLRLLLSDISEHFEHVPLPTHGKGYVSETTDRSVLSKNSIMTEDPRIAMLMRWRHGDAYDRVIPDTVSSAWRGGSANRTARLKFVPKTYKSRRSICMEPATLQWAQQSVRLALESAIEHGGYKDIIRIKDQTYNQEGSQFGSRFQLVDTIDLSAASDSISLELVKRIFPKKILGFLLATRSNRVRLPDGKDFAIAKFAPMGSALCFPTQCLIFSAVCLYAVLMHHYDVEADDVTPEMIGSVRTLIHRHYSQDNSRYQPIRVYGDDIICDSRITHLVVHLLRSLGFRTNESKSFVGDSSFRESCGAFHFLGKDVTPIYFRVGRSTGSRVDIAKLSAIVDLCNYARSFKYYRLATYMQRLALTSNVVGVKRRRDETVNPILFSDHPESLAIRVERPRNTHLRKRLASSETLPSLEEAIRRKDTRFLYQRDEVCSIGVSQQKTRGRDDNYSYILWQRTHRGSGTPEFISGRASVGAFQVRVVRRWTPHS